MMTTKPSDPLPIISTTILPTWPTLLYHYYHLTITITIWPTLLHYNYYYHLTITITTWPTVLYHYYCYCYYYQLTITIATWPTLSCIPLQEVVLDLLAEAMLKQVSTSKGFLIDGYPREQAQGVQFEQTVSSLVSSCPTALMYCTLAPYKTV